MAADPQMRWLRLWTDIVSDEKIITLAFEDRWHYIALLCLKRKGALDTGCTRDMLDRRVGAVLGLGVVERDAVRERLIEAQLIDKTWQPIAWSKRQFASDSDPTAALRQRKHRSKSRNSNGPVTRDKRDGNGPVTGMLRPSETETEAEAEAEKDIRNARAPEAPSDMPPAPSQEAFRDLQRRYPSGTYRQSEWLLAERGLDEHLARGASLDEILAGVERYRAQCDAKGSTGTQFVLSPSKFFDLTRPQFREPFPLPRTKAEAQQDQNIGAAKDWLAAGGAS